MDSYENDFEAAMLKDTAAYYSRKASNWILEDSCPDYMLKVGIYIFFLVLGSDIYQFGNYVYFPIRLFGIQAEECLKREKDRVAHYLHSSSEPKLLEVCSSYC